MANILQATALHQASPVRRLMISKPLPFVCTAGVSARRRHFLRDRHSSQRFAGRYQIASWLPRHNGSQGLISTGIANR